jgi:hypothetical protein
MMNLRSPKITLCLVLLVSTAAEARDWYVRAGSIDGDGSRAMPFNDPWQALEKAEAGDALHVAEGKYYGRLGLGTWKIPYDNMQLIGGYDRDFKTRDPWRHLTELLWDPASKNWPKEERLGSSAKGVVIDGVVIDMKDQTHYTDETQTSRKDMPSENAMMFWNAVTVRNCVIVNPGNYGIVTTGAALIENNLIVNAIGWAISIRMGQKEPATIRNNTMVFTWTYKDPGKGAYQGSPISLSGPALVTNNIIAHNDNHGILTTTAPDRVSITNNLFFMNLFSNVKSGFDGKDFIVDDKSMELLEEMGFKAYDGNEIKNPQLPFDPVWLSRYQKRTAGSPGKLVMDDFNKLRQALGLDLKGGAYNEAVGVAPAYAIEKALLLMQPKANIKQGARRIALSVNLSDAVATAEPARTYVKNDLANWLGNPSSVEGKALEIVIAVGGVANIGGIPSQFDKKDYAAAVIYDRSSGDLRATAFFKKGSNAQRAIDAASGWYQGTGKPSRLFLARGVAMLTTGLPKAGFLLESLEPYTDAAPVAKAVTGKDWFVRAGSTGGNGSREKPFRDPYQALEKVEQGDTIHVSEGEYNGQMKVGQWRIDTPNISLLGGYDKDFKTRNPWKHPTRLQAGDTKSRKGGFTIEGVDDHAGAVIDGFVFDRFVNNKYNPDGDLDYSLSEKSVHLRLFKQDCIVRNNVFLNGAEGAVRMGTAQTFENNIVINHYQFAIKVSSQEDPRPFVFRNNTVAFAWDLRFGQGLGAGGYLLDLGGRVQAVVDNNVFEFADNDAIRMAAEATGVELTRNSFSHNLWSNVQRPGAMEAVDDKTFAKLADFGFKKNTGNVVQSANLPLPKQWFDVYLGRVAYTPGKVTMDEWNQLREIMGQPVLATGASAGSGRAPAFPWKDALNVFPKNPKTTQGARAMDLPVEFKGVERTEESHEYEEVTWDSSARTPDAWAKLDGRRVAIKVVIREPSTSYYLPDISKDDHLCFTTVGPSGNEGGLPLRSYVKKGTRQERMVRQAKSEQTYIVRGIAREKKQMVVEQVERVD